MALGTDIAMTLDEEGAALDLDPYFGLVSGREALAQAVARRLTAERGSLFYDPNYGTDIRLSLNAAMSEAGIFRLRTAIEAEAMKDERVERARAEVEIEDSGQRIAVRLYLTDSAGPFQLVLAVTPDLVEILETA